jgi:hypothetical protein
MLARNCGSLYGLGKVAENSLTNLHLSCLGCHYSNFHFLLYINRAQGMKVLHISHCCCGKLVGVAKVNVACTDTFWYAL